MDMNAAPVVVEQTFNVPIAMVWKAITDKDQMRQWFFETMTDFEPKAGFQRHFSVWCEVRDYLRGKDLCITRVNKTFCP